MTVPNLLLRFCLFYIGLIIVAWIVLVLLRLENFVGLDAALLFGAITLVSRQFAKSNGRYFSKEEKTRVILGMLAIDFVIQVVLSVFPSILFSGRVPQPGPIALMLGIVVFIHFLAISLFVTMERRFLVKQGLIEA